MRSVTYSNGATVFWDDTLQVGELITAYDDGFFILTGFDYQEGATPIVHHVMAVKPNGERAKNAKAIRQCDASYCRRVTKADIDRMYQDETSAAARKRDNLLNFVTR